MPQLVDCPDQAALEAFLLGKLPAPDAEALETHLTTCPACASSLDGLRDADTLTGLVLRAGPIESDSMPPPALESLLGKLDRLGPIAPESAPTGGTRIQHRPESMPTEPITEPFDGLDPPQDPSELGRLGNYRVLRPLGRGGMGVVFLAEDERLRRPVALKLMRADVAAKPSARERFLREARAAAALDHHHVVAIYQVGEHTPAAGGLPVPFIAMPLLEGESLEDRLRRGPLPPDEAVAIARQMAEGLAAAHAKGLIHRDVKPANVWLQRSAGPQADSPLEQVKLLDFGLARTSEAADGLTQSGAVLGTPAYMAPEQAAGEPVDARADLFSLGVTLYRMLTGQLPFAGTHVMAVLRSVALDHPPAPRTVNPAVPAEVSDVTMRLLAKEREQRPATAGEVARELARLAQPGVKPLRKPRGLALVTALAALVLLAGVVIIRVKRPDGTEATVTLPEGATAAVDAKGEVTVKAARKLPAAPEESRFPLEPHAWVSRPAKLPGLASWSVERARTDGIAPGARAVALSPDGQLVAITASNGLIRIRETATGRLKQILMTTNVSSLQEPFLEWSPDGKTLVTSLHGSHTQIWDVASGQVKTTIRVDSRPRWSPDGKKLSLTGTPAGSFDLQIWDSTTKQVTTVLDAKTSAVAGWSPDGRRLAVVNRDRLLLVDPDTLETVKKVDHDLLRGSTDLIWAPDGRRMIIAGNHLPITIWDADELKLQYEIPETRGQNVARPLAWTKEGLLIISLANNGRLGLWDLDQRKLVRTMPESTGVSSFDLARNGTVYVTTWPYGPRPNVVVRDWETQQPIRTLESPELDATNYYGTHAWSPNNRTLAWPDSGTGLLRVWDADRGEQTGVIGGMNLQGVGVGIVAPEWSPDGRWFVYGSRAQIVDMTRLTAVGSLSNTAYLARWLDSNRIVSWDAAKLTIWDARRQSVIRSWKPPQQLNNLAPSPDGKRLLVWSSENPGARVLDLQQEDKSIVLENARGWALQWSPDGSRIYGYRASPEEYGYWDAQTGQWIEKAFATTDRFLFQIAWSADGRRTAALLGNGLYIVSENTRELKQHPIRAWGFTSLFSPGGDRLSVSRFFSTYLYRTSDGEGLGVMSVFPKGAWLTVNDEGHYRGSEGIDKELIYLAEHDDGRRELFTPAEFEAKFGWKNDPQRVRLTVD